MHYMILIHDDLEGYSRYSREQLGEVMDKMGEWSQNLRRAGRHKGAQKLTDSGGRVISKSGVTDGPLAESKEVIGGFFIIEADDFAQATKIAQECPALQLASRIELREVAGGCEGILERSAQT